MSTEKKKRLTSKLYTETRFTRGKGWTYESLPDGCLYSNRNRPTKITKEDIPEYYMHGRFYKHFGWLCAKGVKHLVYEPNYIFNHFHKDDDLYISYDKPITYRIEESVWGRKRKVYEGYDHRIDGSQLVHFIQYIQKYSPEVDVKPIIHEIYKKSRWMISTYPDDVEVTSGDRIAYLDKIFGGDPISEEGEQSND